MHTKDHAKKQHAQHANMTWKIPCHILFPRRSPVTLVQASDQLRSFPLNQRAPKGLQDLAVFAQQNAALHPKLHPRYTAASVRRR